MPRKRTASFILELPLKTDPADDRACAIILDAGRNIGNAVLGEGLCRLDLMRESRAYRAARKMSRGEPRSPERKARANEFKRLFEGFGFTGHALQKFAQGCRDKCWIRDHLPGHVAQTAATRAFTPVREGLEGCGSVPASGVERIRTCEREGLCPSSRHSWHQSGSLKKISCRSLRGWGWCSAGRFASVESPRERRSTAAVTMATRLSMQAPPFQRGEASHAHCFVDPFGRDRRCRSRREHEPAWHHCGRRGRASRRRSEHPARGTATIATIRANVTTPRAPAGSVSLAGSHHTPAGVATNIAPLPGVSTRGRRQQ
jgi:hypothetical protein